MIITVRGLKRSEGVIPESKTTYSGWKVFFTYKALDPDIVGEDVGDRFFSDRLLCGVVPNVGDRLEIIINLDGKIVSLKPYLEDKPRNFGSNANVK